MHEMAIAEGILDIALDYARKNGARRIGEIGLQIGEMAGVEGEALSMAFHAISQGTIAEGARLVRKDVPLIGKCSHCGRECHIEHYDFTCPACKEGVLGILSGRELQVEYLEVD